MLRQGKSRGDMHIPPPGMIRYPGLHFDQALDQPVNGPPNFFTPDIKLANYMEEIGSQNPLLEPGLIGFDPLVLSRRRVFFPSLIQFSISALPL
jgi:hypothetical protein